MQAYRFRGKKIDGIGWAYGSLVTGGLFGESLDKCWIFVYGTGTFHEVDPETVGMWTGLKDIEGKDIYQGDIVLTKKYWKYRFSDKKRWKRFHGLVVFEANQTTGEAHWDVCVEDKEDYDYEAYGSFDDCKIISNTHDTPHLLTPAKGAVTNTMNNLDPNNAQASEQEAAGQAQADVANEQVAAVEQEAQEQAMESAEEGGAEG